MTSIHTGLEGFTFPDFSARAVVDIAAEAGFTHAGIRAIDPTSNTPGLSAVDAGELLRHAEDRGVTLFGADIFNLEGSRDRWRECVESVAAAGIDRVSAFCRGDVTESVREAFRELAVITSGQGITAYLEPVAYFGVRTIAQAADLISDAGSGGITVDTLQFARADDDLALLAEMAQDIPVWLQICDGPPVDSLLAESTSPQEQQAALRHESIADRLLPGKGACGVAEIVQTVRNARPAEPLVLMVEAPSLEQVRLIGPLSYARACHDATAAVIRELT